MALITLSFRKLSDRLTVGVFAALSPVEKIREACRVLRTEFGLDFPAIHIEPTMNEGQFAQLSKRFVGGNSELVGVIRVSQKLFAPELDDPAVVMSVLFHESVHWHDWRPVVAGLNASLRGTPELRRVAQLREAQAEYDGRFGGGTSRMNRRDIKAAVDLLERALTMTGMAVPDANGGSRHIPNHVDMLRRALLAEIARLQTMLDTKIKTLEIERAPYSDSFGEVKAHAAQLYFLFNYYDVDRISRDTHDPIERRRHGFMVTMLTLLQRHYSRLTPAEREAAKLFLQEPRMAEGLRRVNYPLH